MRTLALLAATAIAVAGAGTRAVAEDAPTVCLLTGFEPFGGDPTNASWEAVKAFEGTTVAGHRIATALLPVVYDEMEKPLLAAIEKHHPRIVLCFGVGTPVVQVETTARNGYHPAKPKDNRGDPPPRAAIAPDGPATIATGLPVERLLAALEKAGIGAQSSDDAGGYLCNECFYRLMRAGRGDAKTAASAVVRRGFVHVPPVGAEDPRGGTFTLERLRQAVRIAVEVVAEDAKRPERLAGADDGPETPERPERPEEPEKPEKPEKPERPEKEKDAGAR